MKAHESVLTVAAVVLLATFAVAASAAPGKAGVPPGKGRKDTAPPTLITPADITAEATGPLGAAVWFSATATDKIDPSPTIAYSPAPGSTFPLGATTVTATATDWRGNSATGTFQVTVQDTTPPVVTCPANITRAVTGPEAVTFTATATDLVDPSPTVSYSPASGSTFPIGTTTVTATATDGTGNSATGTFEVTLDGDPTDGPFAGTYTWFQEGYEWSITISPDWTISGSGQQTELSVLDYYYDGWDEYWYWYLAPLPDGLEASGVLEGYVTDGGDLQADDSYSAWWYDVPAGEYGLGYYQLGVAGSAQLDANGNLVITDPWGGTTVWVRQ